MVSPFWAHKLLVKNTIANYTNWISKAYALSRQLHGKKLFYASTKAPDGDSEHSDSSPNSSPPPMESDMFTYDNFVNYQQNTDLYECIVDLRSGCRL